MCLIISEFIKEVALAFTTGTGDLAGNAASKVGIFTPLSPSSAVFLNLCCGMTGSFQKMLTVKSEGGEFMGASMCSS